MQENSWKTPEEIAKIVGKKTTGRNFGNNQKNEFFPKLTASIAALLPLPQKCQWRAMVRHTASQLQAGFKRHSCLKWLCHTADCMIMSSDMVPQ